MGQSIIKYTKKIFSQRSSGGGGSGSVVSVVPGTNITVDNTDPANPIVSSTVKVPITVANYSALPAPGTATGQPYIVLASQGVPYIGGWVGGTYYPEGYYYDNGVTYTYSKNPYQATQADVDTGTNDDKFVTSKTLTNATVITNKELLSNKSTDVNADQGSSTKYPTVKSVYDWAIGLFATLTGIQTLTNKTVKKRVLVVSPSATPSVNIDNSDIVQITGLNVAITSLTTNLTGTPYHGQMILWQITDAGVAEAITAGSAFTSLTNYPLLTTTVAGVKTEMLTQYNSVTGKHECKWTT